MKNTVKRKVFKTICLVVFLFLASDALLWAGEAKILLINSNASVRKYRTVQDEFKKIIPARVREFDLKGREWKNIDAGDLLSHDPDLVYCIGAKAYYFAENHFSEKKIVFTSIINWLRLRITENTYGVSNELHTRMPIMMFRYIFPDVKKIGVLYSEKYTKQWFEKSRDQAPELGIEIIGKVVSNSRRTISTLGSLIPVTDAIWLISDPLVMPEKKYLLNILKDCDTAKIPVFSYNDAFARIGCVLVVSEDIPTIGRQAAGIAMEALSRGKMNKKVQFPAGSRITLNMRKIEEYKLKYNKDALGSVNDIIK